MTSHADITSRGPGPHDGRLTLALKYADAGLFDQAWDQLRDIAAADDATLPVLHLAAHLRAIAGDHGTVLALTERGLGYAPADISLILLRGAALRALDRAPEALATYRAALTTMPEAVAIWNDLGLTLEAVGDLTGAVSAFESATAHGPDFVTARANLAALYVANGRFAAATQVCEATLKIDPHHLPARVNLAVALIEQARHDEAASILAPVADRPEAADTALYLLHYRSNDPAAVVAAHKAWGAAAPPAAMLTPADPTGRRLRVGYVSQDFRRHSVSYFFEPLLTAHDRHRVETFCYATGGAGDSVTGRLQAVADHWRSVSGLDDDALCGLIRADAIDVLVDLSGHTVGNRLGVFARRAAPVQVTALGYPGTTGLTQIDVRFCDSITDPPGTDAFATERLLRLPRLHCYRPDADAPPVGALPALTAGHVTFGSFNKLAKMSADTVILWARVLQTVPGARLFLKSKALAEEEIRRRTTARFVAQGIAADRLTLFGWVPEDAGHLAAYSRIDVGLDTFPYSGTTTTCEALWMGVPVLTLTGATHASRVSASLLSAVGLSEWIAETADSFVAKAAAFAGDVAHLRELRGNLRRRMEASPLCDGAGYVAAVEAAYRAISDLGGVGEALGADAPSHGAVGADQDRFDLG